MAVGVVDLGDLYVLNNCSKFLARGFHDARHNYGQFPDGDMRAFFAESWRFPIVDAWSDGTNFVPDYASNSVTFIYPLFPGSPAPQSVSVIGTFSNLFEPMELHPVAGEPLLALTVVLPKGRVYTYQYVVDGQPTLDPINPQRATLDNGKTWSRFFTDLCTVPITFESWEWVLLDRMTKRILPFHTAKGQNFLNRYYDMLTAAAKETQYARAFRLDVSVGVVNFIDKLVAKQENHRLMDYRLCLPQIDKAVRAADPYAEPADMPDQVYDDLYTQMASNSVPGWDTSAYGDPSYFLKLLRRHTYEGAFTHPKYGGNVGAAGWAYLEQRFTDATGTTLFDWRRITEQPLGKSQDYRG
jgi:Gluconate 2-dehydrogenase subunit 3